MTDNRTDKNFSGFSINILYVLSIALLAVAVRVMSLEYVEVGGDSLCVWENVVNLVNSGNYIEWTHHTLRWAINLPLYFILKMFGTTQVNYYILPILYSTISAILAFYIGTVLKDRRFGLLSALLLILYPKMTTMGSQLWPGLYEMTYLLGCVLALLCWRKYGGWYLLALAGMLAGCAWGSRVTSIYYGPGILALLYLGKRRVKPVIIFTAFFFFVLGLEWFYFYNATGNSLGRFGVITQTHVTQDELLVSVGQYLLNFLKLVKFRGLLPVVLAGLGVAVWLVRRGDENEKCIAILFLGGLFFNVYMISSLSPLKLAAPVGSRYLTAGTPYLIMVLLLGLRKWHELSPRAATFFKYGLIVAFAAFTLKEVPSQNTFSRLQEDAQNARIITEEKLPVLMRYNAWAPNIIEQSVMGLFGIEKRGRLKINEDDKMMKNGRRMHIMLFEQQTDKDFKPETINGYYYFYSGNEKDLAGSSRVGVSDFSRKDHKLIIVPKESLPQGILKGDPAK
ncbi:Dolichyl-phosphate-mannose-protein mannosyltransferase [Maridesulfovibrio ferrireducens]|uniref:Dolichyl-phosphate-mannose-protein mannosyltransferase n=1 Tax=Maridesulfovibrio ferrireducens TaxID=246191 RepID=A0A1G9CK78_9BACT|nr:glycosyltransferase family 39 protein [Maridesulfovibrio ferrireducens]SDK52090.1 Dolichyl-phosphate-mannose-protein mannosyltransferase [Maridesulfovibrio ferrireducens]